jgi:hypothetical protein
LFGAFNCLADQGTKKTPSPNPTVGIVELGDSVVPVFNHLIETAAQERQAVIDLVTSTTEALNQAEINVKTAEAAVGTAEDAEAEASAALELAKANAVLTVAKASAQVAAENYTTTAPVNELEDRAAALQEKAEDARDAADTLMVEGEEHIASVQAEAEADADIREAEAVYDQAIMIFEVETESILGAYSQQGA